MRISKRLLPDTVGIRRYLGSGPMGDTYEETATQYRARVTRENTLVRDSSGAEIVSSGRVILQPGPVVLPGSYITLPGESTERTVISFSPITGTKTVHHVEVNYR